jgi:hypothetical protein
VATKAPEKLLGTADLCSLTGFRRQTIAAMMKDPREWAVKGGAKNIKGDWFLTVSFYNKWVEERDFVTGGAR